MFVKENPDRKKKQTNSLWYGRSKANQGVVQ